MYVFKNITTLSNFSEISQDIQHGLMETEKSTIISLIPSQHPNKNQAYHKLLLKKKVKREGRAAEIFRHLAKFPGRPSSMAFIRVMIWHV